MNEQTVTKNKETEKPMRVMAYRTLVQGNKVKIQESEGITVDGVFKYNSSPYTTDIKGLFNFLLESYAPDDWAPQHDRVIRVFWDLDASLAPIFKLMGREKCELLHKYGKCSLVPYTVKYNKGKSFSIWGKIKISGRVKPARAFFYHLAQWWPEHQEPEELLEVKYFGELLLKELQKMDLMPLSLPSPVGVWEKCKLVLLDLPNYEDLPKGVTIAAEASTTSWIESFKLGFFSQAIDYDKTGAYISQVKELIDFRVGQWVQTPRYQRDAVYGFALCDIYLYPEVMVHPILYRSLEGKLEARTGRWQRWCTKTELQFITRWGIGEYRIIDGFWLMAPKYEKIVWPQPLKEDAELLIAYKQQEGYQRALAKRMSMYAGKFSEKWAKGLGPYNNTVWAAVIKTNVNLELASWLYMNGIGPTDNEGYRTLLHVSVDGCLLEKPASKMVEGWRQSYQGPALVKSSGLVWYGNKKPKSLTLDDVLDLIEDHPNRKYYERLRPRRVTLGDALQSGNFADLGQVRDMLISLDFFSESYDRDYPKKPKTGGQLLRDKYPSRPMTIDNPRSPQVKI